MTRTSPTVPFSSTTASSTTEALNLRAHRFARVLRLLLAQERREADAAARPEGAAAEAAAGAGADAVAGARSDAAAASAAAVLRERDRARAHRLDDRSRVRLNRRVERRDRLEAPPALRNGYRRDFRRLVLRDLHLLLRCRRRAAAAAAARSRVLLEDTLYSSGCFCLTSSARCADVITATTRSTNPTCTNGGHSSPGRSFARRLRSKIDCEPSQPAATTPLSGPGSGGGPGMVSVALMGMVLSKTVYSRTQQFVATAREVPSEPAPIQDLCSTPATVRTVPVTVRPAGSWPGGNATINRALIGSDRSHHMRLGLPELLVILFIILLIFGANRLPQLCAASAKASRTSRTRQRNGRRKVALVTE